MFVVSRYLQFKTRLCGITPHFKTTLLSGSSNSDLNIFCLLSAERKTLKYEEDQRFDQDLIIKLKLTILANFAEASENFLLGFSFNEILQSFFPTEFTLFQVFPQCCCSWSQEVRPGTPLVRIGGARSSYLPRSDCSPSHLSPRQTLSARGQPITECWPQPGLRYSRHTYRQRSRSPPQSWPGSLSDCWNWKVLN